LEGRHRYCAHHGRNHVPRAFDLDFKLRNIFAAVEIEAGKTTVGAALVDVTALVRGLTAAFGHKAAEKGVTAVSEPGEEPLTFKTDPDKLQKALANLFANAIEFNREGKQVTIRAWREGAIDYFHY